MESFFHKLAQYGLKKFSCRYVAVLCYCSTTAKSSQSLRSSWIRTRINSLMLKWIRVLSSKIPHILCLEAQCSPFLLTKINKMKFPSRIYIQRPNDTQGKGQAVQKKAADLSWMNLKHILRYSVLFLLLAFSNFSSFTFLPREDTYLQFSLITGAGNLV